MPIKKIDISHWDNSWLRKIKGIKHERETAGSAPASQEEPKAPAPPPPAEEKP